MKEDATMAAPKIAAEYIGTGTEHLGGIPAHDLTEDELDALPDERRAELLANAAGDHAIYKLHGNDLKAEAKEIAASPDPGATMPAAEVALPSASTATSASKPAGDKKPADTKGGD